MKIGTNLSWQYHINDLSIKLNRANALLFKMRKYDSPFILLFLTPTYPTTLTPTYPIQRIIILQNRPLKLFFFNQEIFIPVPYSNKTPILKFQDKIYLENILFVFHLFYL